MKKEIKDMIKIMAEYDQLNIEEKLEMESRAIQAMTSAKNADVKEYERLLKMNSGTWHGVSKNERILQEVYGNEVSEPEPETKKKKTKKKVTVKEPEEIEEIDEQQ